MQHQVNSNWCWAATSTSISLYYDPASGWTQCKVACFALPRPDCCAAPTPSACNVSFYLNQALTVTGNFVNMVNNPLPIAQIETEINAYRVIGVRIGWFGGGGHFIAIYGFDDSTGSDYVYADDPIYGKSYQLLSNFTNNYQSAGQWTHSYFTKRSGGGLMLQYAAIAFDFEEKARVIKERAFPHPIPGPPPEHFAMLPHQTLPHDTYLIDFRDLVGEKMVLHKTGVRVFDSSEPSPMIFEFDSPEKNAKMLQVLHGDEFVKNYQNELSVIANNKNFTSRNFTLRVVRQPNLKVEAFWLADDKNPKEDIFIPVTSTDFLRTGEQLTRQRFSELLFAAARDKDKEPKDEAIGS